jgi:hypothetical protein
LLPDILADPRGVLRDHRNGGLIYLFNPCDGRSGNIVIRLDLAEKARPLGGKPATIVTNSIRTAGVVDTHTPICGELPRTALGDVVIAGGTPPSP